MIEEFKLNAQQSFQHCKHTRAHTLIKDNHYGWQETVTATN